MKRYPLIAFLIVLVVFIIIIAGVIFMLVSRYKKKPTSPAALYALSPNPPQLLFLQDNPIYRKYTDATIGCPLGSSPLQSRLVVIGQNSNDDGAAVWQCSNDPECAAVVWHSTGDGMSYALPCSCSSGESSSILPGVPGWGDIVYVKAGIGNCFDGADQCTPTPNSAMTQNIYDMANPGTDNQTYACWNPYQWTPFDDTSGTGCCSTCFQLAQQFGIDNNSCWLSNANGCNTGNDNYFPYWNGSGCVDCSPCVTGWRSKVSSEIIQGAVQAVDAFS